MERHTIRILLIEDNLNHARLLQETLAAGQTVPFEIVHSSRLDTALQRLTAEFFDVILLDLSLPDSQGLETFAAVSAHTAHVPIVVLTGLDDETVATMAVQQGAQDYLVKGEVDGKSLVRAVQYAIERHRLQMVVQQVLRQDLQRKETLLSHVSHELHSPLTAISQSVTILLDGLAGALNAEQYAYLEIALKNVQRLHTMINDLLEGSRAETGMLTIAPRWTSLSTLVSDTFEAFRTRALSQDIALRSELPQKLPAVYADPDRIIQVLSNLIDNGMQFIPAHGTITVQAGLYDQDPNFLCVTVCDTGCGIRPEDTEKLFERLYQSPETSDMARQGLGRGLSICRDLVARHGGRMWLESQYGSGAAFFFTLPIFSLSTLLAPLLTMSDLQEIVLMTVMVHPKVERPLLPTDEAALQEVQRVLERCISPDRDILLPGSTRRQQTTLFCIVACAAPAGAEVLSQRIYRQLAGCEVLQQAGLAAVVSWAQVAPRARESDAACAPCLADIVHSIETMMEAALRQEGS